MAAEVRPAEARLQCGESVGGQPARRLPSGAAAASLLFRSQRPCDERDVQLAVTVVPALPQRLWTLAQECEQQRCQEPRPNPTASRQATEASGKQAR